MVQGSHGRPMVAVLDERSSLASMAEVIALAEQCGVSAPVVRGDGWAAIGLGDGTRTVPVERLLRLSAVRRLVPVDSPYRLAAREVLERDTTVVLGGRRDQGKVRGTMIVGQGAPIAVIAGAASHRPIRQHSPLLASGLRDAGAHVFHAGPLLPRRAPAGRPGSALQRLRGTCDELGMALCVEVADPHVIDEACRHADLIEVGGRNMQNFGLLRELGRTEMPILLKRGASATVEEFLLAAEYVLANGNGRVILCESGIRTFDAVWSPRFEINAIPLLKMATHLPVVADPAHATAHPRLVPAVARAAVAAGADGLVLEVADEGGKNGSQGADDLRSLLADLRPIADAVGRSG